MEKIKYEYWGRGLNDGSKSGMTENENCCCRIILEKERIAESEDVRHGLGDHCSDDVPLEEQE